MLPAPEMLREPQIFWLTRNEASLLYDVINVAMAIRLASLKRAEDTGLASTGGNRLRLVALCGTLELLADLLHAASAGSGIDGRSVTEVGVDANEELTVASLDTLDVDVALCGLLAVTARAV